MRVRVRRPVAVVVAIAALAGAALAAAVAADVSRVGAAERPARRVLVFAVPYTSWDDITSAGTPTLDRFVRRAAIAGLSTRVEERFTPLADGYATFGAGSRAVAVGDATQGGLMADERFGATTAGDAYEQRTGRPVRDAIVQTAIVGLLGANASRDFDAEVGALAEALDATGISRAVIANADGEEPDAARSTIDVTPSPARQREAVLSLMDHDGEVEGGRVDPGLLVADRGAPFGVRLDPAEVSASFADAWTDRTVTVVEASDLVRLARYRPYTSAVEHERLRAATLRRADRQLAALLARVDLGRDVVMVVGPAHDPDEVTLTPLAVRGPGFRAGLLQSGTTRRAGFVQIQDLAPTILDALGVEIPSAMEGRAAVVAGTGGDAAARIDMIRREDAAAQFRDARIGEVYGLFAGVVALVLGLGLVVCLTDRGDRWRGAARFAGLWTLGLVAAAFLVRLAPLHELGVVPFYGVFLGVGALMGWAAWAVGRRRPLDGLTAALLAIVGLLVLDALRGAPLVLNSVLGYSPTVAGRFAGFGNPAYAAFSAAALCGAVLLAHRLGGRRGLAAATAILVVAVVVDVAPMWGSDVGGILSMVPAYAVALVVLSGRRVRIRTVVAAVVAVVVVAAAAALVDFARPEADRTHLGRLVERVRDNGVGEGWTVVERKLSMNLATLGTSILGLVLLFAVVATIVLWRRHRDRVEAVLTEVPEWRAACIGFAVLAVLGFALNDSGMTVPGIMLVVFVAAWVHLLASTATPVPGAPGPVDAPDASALAAVDP